MKKINFILKKNFFFKKKKKISCLINKNSNEKKNKFFLKKNYFLTKLINIFVKNGLKKKIRKFIFFCFFKLKKINLILECLFFKLNSKFYNKKLFKNRKVFILPFLTNFKKGYLIGIKWFKLALKLRKERTFKLKFFSELKDLLNNKGLTVKIKKNYFLESYRNLIINQKFKKMLIKKF